MRQRERTVVLAVVAAANYIVIAMAIVLIVRGTNAQKNPASVQEAEHAVAFASR